MRKAPCRWQRLHHARDGCVILRGRLQAHGRNVWPRLRSARRPVSRSSSTTDIGLDWQLMAMASARAGPRQNTSRQFFSAIRRSQAGQSGHIWQLRIAGPELAFAEAIKRTPYPTARDPADGKQPSRFLPWRGIDARLAADRESTCERSEVGDLHEAKRRARTIARRKTCKITDHAAAKRDDGIVALDARMKAPCRKRQQWFQALVFSPAGG